ncbi:hypothetical protein ACEPVF_14300, partial [Pseudomonas aeruginosa]
RKKACFLFTLPKPSWHVLFRVWRSESRADPHGAGVLAFAVPIPIRELGPRFEEKDERWLPMKGIA